MWLSNCNIHLRLFSVSCDLRTGMLLHFRFLQLVNHYTGWLWGKCEGVDPNRNFDYHWGEMEEGGTSLDPCHETYAGPRAFSEPETKAMADYILANKQNIR